ncbi:aspartyl protease [Thermoplasmatota archaeon]
MIFDYIKYPIIPVKFFYKDKKTPFIEALLDSGGDFIVIPMPIAKYLELKLEKAGEVDTAGGAVSLFKSYIDITIGKNGGIAEYKNNLIHVSTRSDIPVLLGRSPLFEDYEITFKKHSNQLILRESKQLFQ